LALTAVSLIEAARPGELVVVDLEQVAIGAVRACPVLNHPAGPVIDRPVGRPERS
jgi:hypothetical protein